MAGIQHDDVSSTLDNNSRTSTTSMVPDYFDDTADDAQSELDVPIVKKLEEQE